MGHVAKHKSFLQREAAPRKYMILQELPPVYPLPPVHPRLYLLAPNVGAGQHQSRGLVMATGAAEVEAFVDKAGPAHCTMYVRLKLNDLRLQITRNRLNHTACHYLPRGLGPYPITCWLVAVV